jgi:spore germination protein KC
MRRNYVALLSLPFLIVPLLLTGCYDKIELEDQAFVTAMGFDKGPNNTIDITVRTAVPSKLSGGQSGGSGGGGGEDPVLSGSKPITVRAHTLAEGMNLVNSSVERKLSLLHCAIILFGEDLAKAGVLEQLQALSRYHEFRQTTYMQLAKGSAKEVMNSEKPIYEQNDVRLAEDLSSLGRHTGFIAKSTMHDVLNYFAAPGEDAFMPILSVNKKVKDAEDQEKAKEKGGPSNISRLQGGGEGTGQSNQKKEPKLEGNEPSFEPGKVIRLGGNPVEFIGTAVFRDDRLVTTLDGVQTRMLLALRGELNRIQIEIKSPFNSKKYVGVEITRIIPPIYNYELKGNPLKIHLEEDMEGELFGDQLGTDYSQEGNMRKLEKQVNEAIEREQEQMVTEVLNRYQSDPFGFSRSARSSFLTFQEMQSYPWRQKYKTAQVQIKVDFKLRRTGLLLSPITHNVNEK